MNCMIADLARIEHQLSQQSQIVAILRSLPNFLNNAKQILSLNKSITIVKELSQMLEIEFEITNSVGLNITISVS